MPEFLLPFLTALKAHAWSLVVAWCAFGLLSFLLAHRSQVDAWAESHPRMAGLMKLLRSFGLDPWLLLQGLSLIIRAKLPSTVAAETAQAKDRNANPPPWHPRGGGGTAALLVAAALALGSGTGCSSGLPAIADKAGAASRVVVPMSKDALKLLRKERDRLVDEKLLAGDALVKTDAALAEVDAVIQRVERGEKPTREELRKAIDAATWANQLLIAAGGTPPPLVASAIDVARRVVDEAE